MKITQVELAGVLETSVQSLIAWKKDGMPPDLAGAVAWVRRNKPIAGDGDTLVDSKKRKLDAEARLKEIDLMVREGELIKRDEAKDWVGAEIDTAKRAFLSLPRRLPGMLKGKDERDMEPVIRAEIKGVYRDW